MASFGIHALKQDSSDITDRQKLLRENFSPVFFNELTTLSQVFRGNTFGGLSRRV